MAIVSPEHWCALFALRDRQRSRDGRITNALAAMWLDAWLAECAWGIEPHEDDDGLARRLRVFGATPAQARAAVAAKRGALCP